MRRRRSLTRGHTLNPLPRSSETEPLAQASLASTARIEIHHFTTMTVTDKQFLTGAKDGIPARIGGELRLPSRTGRVPAVTIIHGSAGVGANVDRRHTPG